MNFPNPNNNYEYDLHNGYKLSWAGNLKGSGTFFAIVGLVLIAVRIWG